MKTHIATISILVLIGIGTASAETRPVSEPVRDPAQVARVAHAKELLGKRYERTLAGTLDNASDLKSFIRKTTKEALQSHWKKLAPKVAKAILQESKRYGFDPLFLVAVIQTESSFNPEAVGTSGEIGLMQLMPQTASWIADRFDLSWKGTKTLRDPVQNIRIGAAYLSLLREQFGNDGRLYISAYNMGPKNLKRNVSQDFIPVTYAKRVMKKYLKCYALMSARDRS